MPCHYFSSLTKVISIIAIAVSGNCAALDTFRFFSRMKIILIKVKTPEVVPISESLHQWKFWLHLWELYRFKSIPRSSWESFSWNWDLSYIVKEFLGVWGSVNSCSLVAKSFAQHSTSVSSPVVFHELFFLWLLLLWRTNYLSHGTNPKLSKICRTNL